MVTSHLMGGLGNQMFQVATATSLALDNDDEIIFSHKNVGDMKHKRPSFYRENVYKHINFTEFVKYKTVFKEREFSYSPIPYTPNMCIYGYFQSEKYFTHNRNHIQKLFIDNETYMRVRNKYNNILKDTEIVSLHIRRGDYVNLQNYHPTCTLEYYCNAMELFPDVTYLIFSDDILWCKLNLPLGPKYIFIEGNEDYEDLYLMSMCNHNIIANSSFSWWAAWLNENENKKVIAPQIWFGPSSNHLDTKDLYCEGWAVL